MRFDQERTYLLSFFVDVLVELVGLEYGFVLLFELV